MNYGESGLSASDVALLSGGGARNSGDGMFGDNGAWWVIIFLIFAFAGFGRNGFGGGFGGSGGGVTDNYVLASDFATIQRQIDSATNTLERKADATQQGLCDGFYAMNTGMLNGFSGVQNTLCQGFAGINQNIVTNGYETRNSIFDVSRQIADCCCKTQNSISELGYKLQDCCCTLGRGQDAINYNMAMNTNAIQQTLCNSTRDLIENQNANYRALHDELIANKLEMKNDRIAEQQNEINALRLRASQEAQNNFLIERLGTKCAEPAYIVPNPNCCYNYNVTGFGYGNNCGCGCN